MFDKHDIDFFGQDQPIFTTFKRVHINTTHLKMLKFSRREFDSDLGIDTFRHTKIELSTNNLVRLSLVESVCIQIILLKLLLSFNYFNLQITILVQFFPPKFKWEILNCFWCTFDNK